MPDQFKNQDFIICPHCLRVDPQGWQLLEEWTKDGEQHTYKCNYSGCRWEFTVTIHIRATFTSTLPATEPESKG